jgi:hypothetical protein
MVVAACYMLHRMEESNDSNLNTLSVPLMVLLLAVLYVSQTQRESPSNFLCNKSGEETYSDRADGGGGVLHGMESNESNESNLNTLFSPLNGSTAALLIDFSSTPVMVSQTQRKSQSNFV